MLALEGWAALGSRCGLLCCHILQQLYKLHSSGIGRASATATHCSCSQRYALKDHTCLLLVRVPRLASLQPVATWGLVQIAKAQGAFVATTCSSRNIEFVTKTLGADQAVDYTKDK